MFHARHAGKCLTTGSWVEVGWWHPFVSFANFFFIFLKDFFDIDHFQSLYWLCYNIVPAWCFRLLDCKTCGILAPPTRDQNCTPCIGGLKQLTTREVLSFGDFRGVDTLTDLKLISWHHWVQSWEEIWRGRPLYTQCIRAAVTEYLSDIYFS